MFLQNNNSKQMKKRIIFFILLITTNYSLISQEIKYNIVVEYTTVISWGSPKTFTSKLFIGDSATCFVMHETKEGSFTFDEEKKHVEMIIATDKPNLYLRRSGDDSFLCSEQVFDKSFLVIDNPKGIDWEITNETKTIADTYFCRKAIGAFRGRMYTVWFCEDIPVSSGPFKLEGLPGLILEAYDSSDEVQFKIKSLSMTKGSYHISFKNMQRIGWDEYKELSVQKVKRFRAFMKSSNNNMDTDIKIGLIKSIEQSIYENY